MNGTQKIRYCVRHSLFAPLITAFYSRQFEQTVHEIHTRSFKSFWLRRM